MASSKTPPRPEPRARSADVRRAQQEPGRDRHEPLPTWRNTRPRGNPETDRGDMERSWERMDALLGR